MDKGVLDELVADAFVRAKTYVARESSQPLLFPASLTEEQGAEIRAVLDKGYDDSETLTAAVRAIITHFVDGKNPNQSSDARHIIYLAGAPPSKQLLLEAVKADDTGNSAINALRATLKTGVQFDFQEAKTLFTQLTNENLDGHNYAKFRGLFSGMDQVVATYAQDQNLDMIRDNTMAAGPDHADRARVLSVLQKEQKSGGKLGMVAIALTPNQARKEAVQFGISGEEAAARASQFAAFFPIVRDQFPTMDITLLDKDLNPIFVRENGEVTVTAEGTMAAWQTADGLSRVSSSPKNGGSQR